MNPKNDGGSAFPVSPSMKFDGQLHVPEPGMSLRDHFATKALESAFPQFRAGGFELTRNDLAKSCWEMADAMLAERNK